MCIYGVIYEYLLSVDLINLKEYVKLVDLLEVLDGLIEVGVFIKCGEWV